ncbi:hypothetical protein AO384_1717 [Moraxella catarrhalis]|uniref:Uncharacterized protein n=1 Tax=Moraxella catarrhalis TaxID=480 RepID=A0A198UEY5_MORCA|nr:hypothetical protein AO384_1717 [Moraxella catarrhalis]
MLECLGTPASSIGAEYLFGDDDKEILLLATDPANQPKINRDLFYVKIR